MNSELWNVWNDKHDSDGQRKRIESARKANMTPVSIDRDNGTGEFSGSTHYKTSLSECECMDFKRRKLPCKHMYRLAIELGVMEGVAESDSTQIRVPKSERASLEPVIEVIESLTENQIELLYELMKQILFVKRSPVITEKTDDIDELVVHGLLLESKRIDIALDGITKKDVIDKLESLGLSGFSKRAKKTDIIEWAYDNLDSIETLIEDIYIVGINNKMEGILLFDEKKRHRRILRS